MTNEDLPDYGPFSRDGTMRSVASTTTTRLHQPRSSVRPPPSDVPETIPEDSPATSNEVVEVDSEDEAKSPSKFRGFVQSHLW